MPGMYHRERKEIVAILVRCVSTLGALPSRRFSSDASGFVPFWLLHLCVTIQSMRCLSAQSVSVALLIAVLTMSPVRIGFAQSGVPQSQGTVLDKDALRPVEENGRW